MHSTQDSAASERPIRWLQLAIASVGIGYVVLFLALAHRRLLYPFALEWMEGVSLQHLARVLEGEPIYAPPSLDFVASLYPPLYYYAGALAAGFTGLDFAALRGVSIAAAVGTIGLIAGYVLRETRSGFCAVASGCLFAATYALSGAFLDVARIDSLFVFFIVAALYSQRFSTSTVGDCTTGALIALACLTKQTGLSIFAPLLLLQIVLRRRGAWTSAIAAGVALAAGYGLLAATEGRWPFFYMFEILRGSELRPSFVLRFWSQDVAPLFVAIGFAVAFLAASFRSGERGDGWYFTGLFAVLLGTCWMARINRGGHLNTLIPFFAGLAILSGLALHRAAAWRRSDGTASTRSLEPASLLLFLLQLLVLAYRPAAWLPTADDVQTGEKLIGFIRETRGEVLIPNHEYLNLLAGRRAHAHATAINDVIGFTGEMPPEAEVLQDELRRAFEERRFEAIVVDDWRTLGFFGEIENRGYYRPEANPLFDQDQHFIPVTGWPTRPRQLFRRQTRPKTRAFDSR